MKNHLIVLAMIVGLIPTSSVAQRTDTLTLDDYVSIYKSLEKKTDMFVKEHWTIRDQGLISEVLFELVNFQGEGDKELNRVRQESSAFVKKNGDRLLRIECRKRSHDNEIEQMDFFEMGDDAQPIASLSDYAYIRTLLGSATYAKVKSKPDDALRFASGAVACDLYFHATNPEMMLWSTIAR